MRQVINCKQLNLETFDNLPKQTLFRSYTGRYGVCYLMGVDGLVNKFKKRDVELYNKFKERNNGKISWYIVVDFILRKSCIVGIGIWNEYYMIQTVKDGRAYNKGFITLYELGYPSMQVEYVRGLLDYYCMGGVSVKEVMKKRWMDGWLAGVGVQIDEERSARLAHLTGSRLIYLP